MLSLDAFLSRIWPSRGDLVVVQLKATADGTIPTHFPFANSNRSQAIAKIRELEQARANIYIALAGYALGKVKRNTGRTAKNADAFRTVWLDVDCGAGKDYADRPAAAQALQAFVIASNLPEPLLVSSGGGFHAYWPLDVDIDLDTWRPLALGLKQLCLQHGLRTDAKCTADAARILRPVETTNWKTGAARHVRAAHDVAPSSLAALQTCLLSEPVVLQQINHPHVNGNSYGPLNGNAYGLTTLDSTLPTDFNGEKIYNECQQMQWAALNPEDVREPMWRELIGTLYKSDRPDLIHELSKGHSAYDYAETEAKAQNWKGKGALCSSLEQSNPGGCSGCVHYGKITSPSAIGFVSAPIPIIKVDPDTHMPKGWRHHEGMLQMATEEGPVIIYPGLIEVGNPFMERDSFGRQRTSIEVATVVHDHRTEGSVNYATIYTTSELCKALTGCGIVTELRHQKVFTAGMRAWLEEARKKVPFTSVHQQLGWTATTAYDHAASFILGNTIYHADGTHAAVKLVEQAGSISKAIHRNGTLADWQQAYNLLGLPGYEAQMVMSWIAFAAPLIRFDAVAPALVHAYSQSTAQGKTTVLHFINSVYGDPNNANLFWTGNSTQNAIQTGLTILNGISMGVDEITLLHPDASRKLLYEVTQQTGRKRNKQDGTMQETAMTKTLLYSTGNASLQNNASLMQTDDTPLQMRIAELTFQLPPMTAAERGARRQLTDSVQKHFGHAAPIYIEYVVQHQAKVAQILAAVRAKLEREIAFETDERFQISSMAAMITGAMLARKLKLIDHPVEAGTAWIVDWFVQQRRERERMANTPARLLEQMLHAFELNTIVVDKDKPGSPVAFVNTINKPMREIYGRHAQEEQVFYLYKREANKWLARHGLDTKGTIDKWRAQGLLVKETRTDLGAFTHRSMPQRDYCYQFDLAQLDL